MRQLQDVEVEGMALVRRPANKKRFLTKKSEEAAVPTDSASQIEAPTAAITDAIDAIKLSKSEDAREALHTAAHLLKSESLTLQDLMAYGQALGLEDIAKADDKKDKKKDDMEGEDMEDGKKKNPFAKSESEAPVEPAKPVETPNTASASEGEGEKMPSDETRDAISKSEHQQLIARLAKSEAALAGFQHKEEVRIEKSANQAAYSNLEVDHDALADVTLALRKSSDAHFKTFERIMKAADEQVRVASASGGSPFRPQSIRGGLAKSEQQGISQWKELIQKHRAANPKMTESEAITAVAKSAEGLEAYRAAKGNI